jgi:hypothetical protein
MSLIRAQEKYNWFSHEVIDEARRRLALSAMDDAKAETDGKRLAPLLTLQAMPKKDAGSDT